MSLKPPPEPRRHCDRIPRIQIIASQAWFRICASHHDIPIHYGRTAKNRFDDPSRRFGVLYLADSVDCAFAETFGHGIAQRFSPTDDKTLSLSDLRHRQVWQLRPYRNLTVVDLVGDGVAKLNLDGTINTRPERALPQQWAAWFHSCRTRKRRIDGILYPSRHLPAGRCLAVFEPNPPGWRARKGGTLDAWADPQTGRTIWNVLDAQGWGVSLL